MSGLFAGLLEARRAQMFKMHVQPRATYVHNKPPKDKISGGESVFVQCLRPSSVLLVGFCLIWTIIKRDSDA